MAVHIVLVKLPFAILTHQQFRVKYYYSQSSFRTPPVPSVFEDNPVYRRTVFYLSIYLSTAENEPKVCPLSVYRSPRFASPWKEDARDRGRADKAKVADPDGVWE